MIYIDLHIWIATVADVDHPQFGHGHSRHVDPETTRIEVDDCTNG